MVNRFFILILIFALTACGDKTVDDLKISQDTVQFVQTNNIKRHALAGDDQQKRVARYLHHYFSPWTDPYYFDHVTQIKSTLSATINHYLKHPGWGENHRRLSKEWITRIVNNIDLKAFPNTHHTAITINETDVRSLPTHEPSFTNWTSPGEGYPFDNLQESHLSTNVPLYIVQTTQDGAWQLAITPYNLAGWVQTKDIATVDSAFIRRWTKKQYVTPLQENIAIKSNKDQLYFLTRLGQIYPQYKTTPEGVQFLIATANADRQAVIKIVQLNKQTLAVFPIPLNTQEIAQLANQLIGQPYGWGGLYGYRDCSATLMDLFAPFGVWLPRNSRHQARQGKVISLSKLSNSEKKAIISREGIPFFTFLTAPGHITLYVGSQDNTPYIFHSRWGIHTYFGSTNGRAIIGRTAITAIDIGKEYLNTKSTFLDEVDRMTLMVPSG